MADRKNNRQRSKTPAKKQAKFFIDLGVALEDDLLVAKEFVDFLKSNIKVAGKKGNLGETITVTVSEKKVAVTSKTDLQKRYLKYLTKKYLKKNDILDYLRLVASDKNTYTIKYVKLGDSAEEEAEA